MVLGLERREVVQDPNKGSKADTANAPLPAIMKPQHSSFNGVGDSPWADALASAKGVVDAYQKKKVDESLINGKMLYAQGATESEIYAKGDRYTTVGYEMMKSHTAMEVFSQQMQQDIANNSHTLDPNTFRETLSAKFTEISDQFKKSDPLVRDALVSQVEEVFPTLVAYQVKANNQYRKEQHGNEFENMLAVSTDPETLKMKMRVGGTELTPEERKRRIANVVERTSNDGNPMSKQAFASMVTGVPEKINLPALANIVKRVESGNGGYNAVSLRDPNPNLTNMTVNEVRAYQEQLKASGAKSTAVGAYQILGSTLELYKQKLNLTGDEKFDESLQDTLFVALAKDGGIDKHLSGNATAEETIASLGKVWAGLPIDPSGKGAYDSDGINKATAHWGEVLTALTGDMDTTKARKVLIDEGFAPEDQDKILRAWDNLAIANSNKFDTDRITMEESITSAALQSGNLPQALQQIKVAKEQFGLSDAWANRQVGAVQTAIDKHMKERQKLQEIDIAISAGTAGTLSGDKQQLAIDRVHSQALQQYPAANSRDNPDYAKHRGIVMDQTFKFMYKNNITDKRLTQKWDTAIMGDIVDSSGLVKQPAMEAYADYKQAIQSTSNKPWVASQMSDKTQALFNLADSYMSTGQTYSAEEALVVAQATLATKLPAGTKHKINPMDMRKTANDIVDSIVPNFWNAYGFGSGSAQNRLQISKDSVQAAVKDPAIMNTIASMASKNMDALVLEDPATAKQLAFEAAKNKFLANSEYVAGSIVHTGSGPTLSQRMGSTRANAANMVVGEILAALGPHVWKDEWNNTDLVAHSQTWYQDTRQNPIEKATQWLSDASETDVLSVGMSKAYEKLKGIPDSKVIFNPTSGALVVYPYRNYERTATLEPLILSQETLQLARQFLEREDRTQFDLLIQDQIKMRGR